MEDSLILNTVAPFYTLVNIFSFLTQNARPLVCASFYLISLNIEWRREIKRCSMKLENWSLGHIFKAEKKDLINTKNFKMYKVAQPHQRHVYFLQNF